MSGGSSGSLGPVSTNASPARYAIPFTEERSELPQSSRTVSSGSPRITALAPVRFSISSGLTVPWAPVTYTSPAVFLTASTTSKNGPRSRTGHCHRSMGEEVMNIFSNPAALRATSAGPILSAFASTMAASCPFPLEKGGAIRLAQGGPHPVVDLPAVADAAGLEWIDQEDPHRFMICIPGGIGNPSRALPLFTPP